MRSHNKKILSKGSKILAEDNKVSSFKTYSFMLCQNLIKTLYVLTGCCLYFLIGNATQNVYNGKFSIINNDFSVTNIKPKSLLSYSIIN